VTVVAGGVVVVAVSGVVVSAGVVCVDVSEPVASPLELSPVEPVIASCETVVVTIACALTAGTVLGTGSDTFDPPHPASATAAIAEAARAMLRRDGLLPPRVLTRRPAPSVDRTSGSH
jgi:hypothetical protein